LNTINYTTISTPGHKPSRSHIGLLQITVRSHFPKIHLQLTKKQTIKQKKNFRDNLMS